METELNYCVVPFINYCDVTYLHGRYTAAATDIKYLFVGGNFPEKLLTNIGHGSELVKHAVTEQKVEYKQESSGIIVTIFI